MQYTNPLKSSQTNSSISSLEKCDENKYGIANCDKKHPHPCNFYMDYGRCKYSDYCKYDHIQLETNIQKDEFKS